MSWCSSFRSFYFCLPRRQLLHLPRAAVLPLHRPRLRPRHRRQLRRDPGVGQPPLPAPTHQLHRGLRRWEDEEGVRQGQRYHGRGSQNTATLSGKRETQAYFFRSLAIFPINTFLGPQCRSTEWMVPKLLGSELQSNLSQAPQGPEKPIPGKPGLAQHSQVAPDLVSPLIKEHN